MKRLRNLGGTAKSIFDVVQFDLALKAIIFAVGNTLVCDELDETKLLSWTGERFKVVIVDGILLSKSTTMTGGTSGGMEARSNKWDDKQVEGLKKKKRFESEFKELGSIGGMQIKESETTGKISGLEKKTSMQILRRQTNLWVFSQTTVSRDECVVVVFYATKAIGDPRLLMHRVLINALCYSPT